MKALAGAIQRRAKKYAISLTATFVEQNHRKSLRGKMRSNQFLLEWKTRNQIDKHVWIVDTKVNMEAPLCEPTRQLRYLNPLIDPKYTSGKKCKSCLRKLVSFKNQFPTIKEVEYKP
jgi:hypothetical protein